MAVGEVVGGRTPPCGASACGDEVHDPARLLLAAPARLLVAPGPGRPAAAGLRAVRRHAEPDARRGQRGRPSVGWMRGDHQHVTLDLFPSWCPVRGLRLGHRAAVRGRDFDVVGAFDVVEHCEDRAGGLRARPGPGPGGRCCCQCRRTTGRGPTTTCAPGTIVATPGRRSSGWWRRPGCRSPGDVRLRRGVPDLRRRARCAPAQVAPPGRGRRQRGLPRSRHVRTGADAAVALDERLLRGDLPFGSWVFAGRRQAPD